MHFFHIFFLRMIIVKPMISKWSLSVRLFDQAKCICDNQFFVKYHVYKEVQMKWMNKLMHQILSNLWLAFIVHKLNKHIVLFTFSLVYSALFVYNTVNLLPFHWEKKKKKNVIGFFFRLFTHWWTLRLRLIIYFPLLTMLKR